MVEKLVSQRREPARVPRDHLSKPVHSSSWSVEKELIGQLRCKRCIRRSQHASKKGHAKGQIIDAISSRERPAEIEDRAIRGHWEGDLISGTKNSHIVTLVERHSRFTTLIKVPSKETTVVVDALSRYVRNLPASLRRWLTWDTRWRNTRPSLRPRM
jgi:IS30 family transposase